MTLREKVLRGGLYLSAREGIGLAVGVLGVLLVTRLIGPTQYGLYRGALDIVAFFAGVSRWGLDAYLVRRKDPPTREVYDQAFSLLLFGAVAFATAGYLSMPLLKRWLADPRYLPPLKVLLAALPFTVLSIPAIARLERELDYRRVAALETAGQVLYHAISVWLAWRGWGVWGPVIGYVLWQVWTTFASWILARYLPRWHWSKPLAGEMLVYGVQYSSSFWVYNLRSLVNPLVVGRFLGPREVGFVSLTVRLVEVLGFVRSATFRVSLAVLGRVQHESARMRRALEDAMGLQALALGLPLAVFSLLAPLVLPRLFGSEWTPALMIYPFIALGFLVGAVFSMHASILYVTQHNLQVTVANSVHAAAFVLSAFLLVPRVGIWGYGLSEIAALSSYTILHRFVSRLFHFNYRNAIPWLLAFTPALFCPLVPWPWRGALLLPVPFIALDSVIRKNVRELWLLFRRSEN